MPAQKERDHQAKGNAFLLPLACLETMGAASILVWERLGGFLKHYACKDGNFFDL